MVCCSSENGRKGPAMLDSGRARWNFGRLLDWHFIHGTRRGDVGKPWTTKTFVDAVGLGDRTVRYRLRCSGSNSGRHPPSRPLANFRSES
jgi:hypothetical protein